MNLIFFGAPGCGKGTQAKILSEKLKVPHYSTGEILREAVRIATPLGLKAKSIMDSGGLVSDEIMIGIINDTLKSEKSKSGFILDGFPRTVNQALELDKILIVLNFTDIKVIYIESNEDELIKRLSNRRACKICSKIFSLSEIENLVNCPSCGANNSFYLRDDDKEEVIKKRLEVFKANTFPVLDFYEKKNICIRVNGLKSIEAVTSEILSKLKL